MLWLFMQGSGMPAKKGSANFESTPARLGRNELNPLQIIDLYAAAKEKAPQANLRGVLFDLQYKRGKVFYRKHGAQLPCGWTSIESLKSQLTAMEVIGE